MHQHKVHGHEKSSSQLQPSNTQMHSHSHPISHVSGTSSGQHQQQQQSNHQRQHQHQHQQACGKLNQEKDKQNFQEHHNHHHQQHHQYPLSSSSSLLPTSSLRDIVSLVMILVSLPHTVSLCLLVAHIVLGSNVTGGKFIIKCLVGDNSESLIVNVKQFTLMLIKIATINSAIFSLLSVAIQKKSHFNYLIMFSKAIISCDLIGSSSINYINSISNKKISSKIQYDDHRRYFNNSILTSIVCFFILNYINYLINWLSDSFDFFNSYNSNVSYINNYNFSQFKNKVYLILSVHIISSSVFKKPRTVHNSISNVLDDISINCDENKLLDINIDDSVSKSSPSSKSSKHIIPVSSSVAIKNFENFIISPFNSRLTTLKNKLRINSFNEASSSRVPAITSGPSLTSSPTTSSTASLSPPGYSTLDGNSSVLVNNNANTTSTTTASTTTSTSTSLTTTTISPHITTIENTIIIQPFWSILAACKAILRNPNLFLGESTKYKNNGGKFIKSSDQIASSTGKFSHIPMATMLIDDSKVIFKFLNERDLKNIDLKNLKIKLNNVNWSYFRFVNFESKNETRLVIYGLTSLFQYEIDVIYQDQVLNHFIINTTNSDENLVLNKSIAETSSLKTLQISLISTIKNLESLKAKFKKFKREQNKKLTESKNNIDNLKSKISKYNNKLNNDQRIYGKLKGLKHSVMQLENEIELLNESIEKLSNEESQIKHSYDIKEAEKLAEIDELEKVAAEYESRINVEKSNLKAIKSDLHAVEVKHQKLLNKQAARSEEIKNLKNDLKNIKKNEIMNKFSKRTKKTHEKYETILPRLIQETEILKEECGNWSNE